MIRLHLRTGTTLAGELVELAGTFVRVMRTEIEYSNGFCLKQEPLRMTVHRSNIVGLVVAAATNGNDLMVDQAGLKAAYPVALALGLPVEIRACPVRPEEFAKELCSLDQGEETMAA